jgi:peptide/nickel transport system permease protein
MRRYVATRIVVIVPTLLLASAAIFALMQLAVGGDPTLYIMGREGSTAQAEALRKDLHLDRSLVVQYVDWLRHVARGDFGRSFQYPLDVRAVIVGRLPATLELAGLAAAAAIAAAIPAGVYMALVPHGFGRLASGFTIAALCLPDFCVGILLIYLFSVMLHWLPSSGYVPLRDGMGRNLAGMVLPVVSLATWYAAAWARYVRSAFLETLDADFVRVARAKGLAEGAVSYRHVLRNAMLPTLTIVGQNVAAMFGGVVAVETVFGNPGIGRLFSTAVLGRDYPVIQGVIVMLTLVVCLSSLLVDVLYGLVDPRVRYG